ncbi:MAG TPA: hypothetical protein VN282_14570 [Pyrinomonadaceae bacterium]|nr:hypothetical protein [Pyrinomonadaceae bacterium]
MVDLSLVGDDGPAPFQGYALIRSKGTTHALEFEFRTSALRPAEVRIPLLLSSSASVRMSVSDVYVKDFELPAPRGTARPLHYITENVTRLTESRETSRLRLVISYEGPAAATTTVLLGDDQTEPRPEVIQRWVWAYALQSFLFFTMSWSCIVGVAVLLVAHLQPLGDKFCFYAVLTGVFTWLAGVCGLPDVAKIPLRPMLRRLYSKTRANSPARFLAGRRRRALLTALSLSFILITSGVGVVIYCLSIRQYYTTLVKRALRSSNEPESRLEDISRALTLLPRRKEAQMLFEREAHALRNPEQMDVFRAFIKKFAMRQDVKRAMAEAPDADHLPLCLTKSAGDSFLSDPVVWYASTIVEGEESHETPLMDEATSLLAARHDPEAQAQLLNLRLGQMLADEAAAEEEKPEVDDLARGLGKLLVENYSGLRRKYVYQAACDTLAGYHLRRCDPEANADGSLKEAARWYKAGLDARKHQVSNDGEPIWLRPPEKLMLFYMFGTGWKLQGEVADEARCLLKTQDCKEPVEELEPCDFGPTFTKELWEPNPDYQKEAAWKSGTLRDEKLNGQLFAQLIEQSLNKGWRY